MLAVVYLYFYLLFLSCVTYEITNCLFSLVKTQQTKIILFFERLLFTFGESKASYFSVTAFMLG